MTMYREMTDQERKLLSSLLARPFPGRDQIRDQVGSALVEQVDANGSLAFKINSTVLCEDVKYAVPTEGEYLDADGMSVHILLHVIGDSVFSVEVYREDLKRLLNPIDIDKMEVFSPE